MTSHSSKSQSLSTKSWRWAHGTLFIWRCFNGRLDSMRFPSYSGAALKRGRHNWLPGYIEVLVRARHSPAPLYGKLSTRNALNMDLPEQEFIFSCHRLTCLDQNGGWSMARSWAECRPHFFTSRNICEVGRSWKKLVPNLLDFEMSGFPLLLMAGEISKTSLRLSNSRKSNSIIFLEI